MFKSPFNFILATDSYKFSHHNQYPPGTDGVFSYIESRGGAYPESLFFGLQGYIKKYLAGVVVTQAMVDEAQVVVDAHMGPGVFNRAGWERIVQVHGGKLPVRICAPKEGLVIPVKNVLVTLESTDPECPWIVSHIETTLLAAVWTSVTVATYSRECLTALEEYYERTGSDPAGLAFAMHDFGFRGSNSIESAAFNAAAHLVNFQGTDTVVGLLHARDYYHAPMAGFSIPAMEHSTVTSWGEEHETWAYANMLARYPKGLVACVSDSYDIYRACDEIWGEDLKDQVMEREGRVVIRPDSGNPVEVVPNVLEILWRRFGGTTNAAGYRVLDPHVRVIQGDGINLESLRHILEAIRVRGFAAENVAFGQGGALLQKHDRDEMQFAMKCSAIRIDGEWHDVQKRPIGDPNKRSKAGRITLVLDPNFEPCTVREDSLTEESEVEYLLEPVFENGVLLRDQTLEEIRTIARTF